MTCTNHSAVFPALAAILALSPPLSAAETLDRTILPIQLPKRELTDGLDARNYKIPQRVEPAEGAPNVVIILINDLGFGAISTSADGMTGMMENTFPW